MLEVTIGKAVHPQQVALVRDALRANGISGNLFIGYPVLATADDTLFLDAVLVSREHGVVLLDVTDNPPSHASDAEGWSRVASRQDEMAFAMAASLSRSKDLRRGRGLGLDVHVVSVLPVAVEPPGDSAVLAAPASEVPGLIEGLPGIDESIWRAANAAIQRISTIKPAVKRSEVARADSRGATLKATEREIANLDQWQKRAAIESPEGPQRIRGLAGSGKTIVLALKAAYLHVQNPDWHIAIVFFTRSLYQQFQDLIRRFTFGTPMTSPTGPISTFFMLGEASTVAGSMRRSPSASESRSGTGPSRRRRMAGQTRFTGSAQSCSTN
jgi:superfamily I DNA and RNA helicase